MTAPSERVVKEVIAAVYGGSDRDRPLTWEQIENDQPLFSLDGGADSLGLDSLDAVEIATTLEERFDLVLPAELDPQELHTVRQLMALLERVYAEQHGAIS